MYLVSLPGTGHGHPAVTIQVGSRTPRLSAWRNFQTSVQRHGPQFCWAGQTGICGTRILGGQSYPQEELQTCTEGPGGAFRGFRPDPAEMSQNVLVARVRPPATGTPSKGHLRWSRASWKPGLKRLMRPGLRHQALRLAASE